MFLSGANIIDVGGESTRPGSKSINKNLEWKRIEKILKELKKKIPISLDTRKAEIMKKGIKAAWDPIIIKALQELITKVETLEARISALESS